MQGNRLKAAKTREKCRFLPVSGVGAVTLHQELDGISEAPALKRVFAETSLNGGSSSLTHEQSLKRGKKNGP